RRFSLPPLPHHIAPAPRSGTDRSSCRALLSRLPLAKEAEPGIDGATPLRAPIVFQIPDARRAGRGESCPHRGYAETRKTSARGASELRRGHPLRAARPVV